MTISSRLNHSDLCNIPCRVWKLGRSGSCHLKRQRPCQWMVTKKKWMNQRLSIDFVSYRRLRVRAHWAASPRHSCGVRRERKATAENRTGREMHTWFLGQSSQRTRWTLWTSSLAFPRKGSCCFFYSYSQKRSWQFKKKVRKDKNLNVEWIKQSQMLVFQ